VRVRSPITFFGSKSKLAPLIIAHFPPHITYVEAFAGSAAVLLAKEPSEVEVFNDPNADLVNLFRVLRDPSLFRSLQRVAESTLYARAEFDLAGIPTVEPVERARRFLVRQRQSRGGLGERWSYCRSDSRANMASVIRRWRAGIERLPAIHERLKKVQIEQCDWREIIDRYDGLSTLFYLDPPYLPSARSAGGKYKHEMCTNDHRLLVVRLLRVQGMVVLSGYQDQTYEPLEAAGWARKSYDVPAYSSDRRSRRSECLWLSPNVAKGPKGPAGTPADRMREGALATHRARASQTEAKLRVIIGKLRDGDEVINISMVAAAAEMSREHLSRRYNYLFSDGP
jgi:DNA adenine methylase